MEIIAPRKKIALETAFMRMFTGGVLFRSAYLGTKIFMLNKSGGLIESVNIHKAADGFEKFVYEDEFATAYQITIDEKDL